MIINFYRNLRLHLFEAFSDESDHYQMFEKLQFNNPRLANKSH